MIKNNNNSRFQQINDSRRFWWFIEMFWSKTPHLMWRFRKNMVGSFTKAENLENKYIEQIDYFRSRNESWPLIFCRKKLNFCLWRSLSFFLPEFARKCWRCNRWGPFIHRSRPGMRQRGRLCWTCCASFTAAEKRIAQIIVSHDLALVTNYNQTYLHRVQSWYCLSKVLPTYLFLLPT